ncbi:MAG: AAA family ATPase [Thermoplasmata archaeon]|nr:AAA family ATPase [Thermoplasmata archaeon]
MAVAGESRSFIGRLDASDALRRRADAAWNGRGGITLVEGETGVGKSTLVESFIAPFREQGMYVLIARSLSLDNPPPFHLIRSARPAGSADRRGDSDIPGGAPPLALAFSQHSDPVILGFAPRADRPALEDRWPVEERLLEALSPPGETTDAHRARLFSSLSDTFLHLAEEAPTLLVLEDIHRADDASIEFLEYLGPQLEHRPLWVVATTLPVSALSENRRSAIERLRRAAETDSITIRPFTAGEVEQFVRTLKSDRPVDMEDITRWHSQTGGNPLFIEQLLRTRRTIGGAGVAGPEGSAGAPRDIAQYLARQLPLLAEDELRVMTVGAILGREFPFQLLLRASGEDEERLSEIVERLVARGILRDRPDEVLEFVHDELRGEVYSNLTDTRRRLLHKRAGEALEATGAADVATIFALARHFYLGKVDEKAALYNRLSAEFASRSYSPGTARPHLERALESHRRALPHDLTGELEMILELAVQLGRLGELKPAEHLLDDALRREALVRGASPAQRALLKIYLARILTDQGQWGEADRLTTELLGSAEARSTPSTLIAVHRLRGELLYYHGRYPESLEQHDAALHIARELGDPREIALETVRRANVLGMIPERVEEAVAAYRYAREELVRLGDRGEAAYALLFLGVVLSQHGRTPEGLVALEEAVKLADEAHDLRRVGWALFNIADLQREMHNLGGATLANERAREILDRVGDRFGLTQTLIVAGKILIDQGEWARAEIELLEAYRLVRELRTPADELDVLLRLALVALGKGEPASARSRADELGRRDVRKIRPDLAPDFDDLLRRLSEAGVDPGPPSA